MLTFLLGIICTVLFLGGLVFAFFSVLGDDVEKLVLSVIVMVIAIALPFIVL